MAEKDDYGNEYVNGAPPNLRIVECCNTCKHVDVQYEGERGCTKYRIRYEWHEPDESVPSYVLQNHICDAHEKEANRG